MLRTLTIVLALGAAVRADDTITVFLDVNVVTMEDGRILRGVSVMTQNGRIEQIAKKMAVPFGWRIVDAKGKWLIPGLSDMHVHNWYQEEHALFLANGVTRIRNLWGTPVHLKWRKEIENGKRLGPKIHTTGPILGGKKPMWEKSVPVTSAEQAKELVGKLQEQGYDSLKVYNRIRKDVYHALMMEARKRKFRVTGHVPYEVGLFEALRMGQSCIEHLEGYVAWPYEMSKHMDRFLALSAQVGVWNCPTLVVYQKFVPHEEAVKLAARPEMRFVPPRLRATWDPKRDFRLKNLGPAQYKVLRKGDRVRKRVTKLIHDATGRLLLGTDAGNPFVVAGWSVHEELQNLVDAGLTPYEALATGTTKPAEYLGDGKGTVAKGERADLVLLEGNPMDDIANTRRIAGVMRAGRWLPKSELDAMLEKVAKSYTEKKDRFAGMAALPEGDKAAYKVTWNGLVVGAERFSVTRKHIVGQRVNDDPWGFRSTVKFAMDARGFITEMTAERVDTFGKKTLTLRRTAGVFYGYPSLATWLSVERQFRGLGNGESRTIRYHELTLEGGEKMTAFPVTVRRDDEKTYTIWMKRPGRRVQEQARRRRKRLARNLHDRPPTRRSKVRTPVGALGAPSFRRNVGEIKGLRRRIATAMSQSSRLRSLPLAEVRLERVHVHVGADVFAQLVQELLDGALPEHRVDELHDREPLEVLVRRVGVKLRRAVLAGSHGPEHAFDVLGQRGVVLVARHAP